MEDVAQIVGASGLPGVTGVVLVDGEGRLASHSIAAEQALGLEVGTPDVLERLQALVLPGQPAVVSLAPDRSTLVQAEGRRYRIERQLLLDGRSLLLIHPEEAISAAPQASFSVLADFLANAAHELRTPLTAILGFSELLLLDDDSGPASESLRHILDAGRGMAGQIDRMVEFVRLELDRVQPERRLVPVRALLLELAQVWQERIDERHLRFQAAIGVEPQLQLRGDPLRIRRIIDELVGNAVRHTDSGLIRVSARREGGRLRIVVGDSGPGIGLAEQERLFLPKVLHGSRRSPREGMGVGLYIARRLARLMEGNLTLEATGPTGSVFCLSLPLGPEQQA